MDSISAYVAAYKTEGYDFIKVHEEGLTLAVLDSVLVAAQRLGIPVAGHVRNPARVEHVLWGYKSIEHPFTDYLWNRRTDSISKWGTRDTTGFGVLAGTIRRAGVWHCPTQAHYERWHFKNPTVMRRFLKVEQDSGVKLLLGTDELPWQGVITSELQAMVTAGLTPYQALLTGTRNVAVYFGTLDEGGTIAAGKRADLVLLTGNPLQDVRYTAQPAGVMLGGRWLPRSEMDRRLAQLTLPTLDGWRGNKAEPVKGYWQNIVDEVVETSSILFEDIEPSGDVERMREAHAAKHMAQRQALLDSLGKSDRYQGGTQRVLNLIVRQLEEDRLALTPAQRVTFDQGVDGWTRKWKGYSVAFKRN